MTGGTASMDQSKLSRRGHTSSRTFSTGRYRNVSVRVTRLGDLAAGLSAAAKVGGPPSPISDIRANSNPAADPDSTTSVRYMPRFYNTSTIRSSRRHICCIESRSVRARRDLHVLTRIVPTARIFKPPSTD